MILRILTLQRLIQDGAIADWDLMERMLQHVFKNELRLSTFTGSDSMLPVLIAEPLSITQSDRQRLTQIMFETFEVPKYAAIPKPVLALHAMGKRSGIVIDSGYESTRIVPVHQGQAIRDAVYTLKVGGVHLTDFLVRIMSERGYSLTTSAERDIVTFSVNLRFISFGI